MKLLIRNLARSTTEAELHALFAAHGTVQFCNLVLDKKSGGSKGFAFVEMGNESDAQAAIQAMDGVDLDGRNLKVNEAKERSSGGGGGGGQRDRW